MQQHELRPPKGAKKDRRRKGRGDGSGRGTYSGRGIKGQNSRSGGGVRPGFEGGQQRLIKGMPMLRGFTNIFRKSYAEVNLGRLQQAIDAGRLDASKPVDAEALKAAGFFKSPRDGVSLLAKGELTAKINISVTRASKAAVAAVEKAGGSVTIVAGRKAAEGEGASEKAKVESAGEKDAGAEA